METYLREGKNLSVEQAERWSGDYPLTVLAEAMPKLAASLGCKASADFVLLYPKKQRKVIESILSDIGLNNLGFKEVRASSAFFGVQYGLQPPAPASTSATAPLTAGTASSTGVTAVDSTFGLGSLPPAGVAPVLAPGGPPAKASSAKAYALGDAKGVRKRLKSFTVRGTGREKIVTLLNEIKRLNLEEFPHAFLYLLRSMFELSAKAYCDDHKHAGGPKTHNSKGVEKSLATLLTDVGNHITQNGADKQKVKLLHGAMTELGKSNGVLSVTSLNQLVHNKSFSVAPSDICIFFGNVFTLFEEMNS